MSLTTPVSIRTLQRKLYCKAKAEPAYRFYRLYDKIHRDDILAHAYGLARSNAGAPGVDGMTFTAVEAIGREEWLAAIRKDLVTKTYRPAPVRRVMIPKPGYAEPDLAPGLETARDYCWSRIAALGGLNSLPGSCCWAVLGLEMSLRQWCLERALHDQPLDERAARGI